MNKTTLKVLIFLCNVIFIHKGFTQDCITELEKYRKNNSNLSQENNELDRANNKLGEQLKAKQDTIIMLSKKIFKLEKDKGMLLLDIKNLKDNLQKKDEEIGASKNEIANLTEQLKKSNNLNEREKLEFRERLKEEKAKLVQSEEQRSSYFKDNQKLVGDLKEKDDFLENYKKVFKEQESEAKDYIHIGKEEVKFDERIFSYGSALFSLEFKEFDKEFKPNPEERRKIRRLVTLVSKYDNKAKIQLLIGSEKNDGNHRKLREEAIKNYILGFPEPFNLTEKNFSKKSKATTDNYNVEITVVKK